MSKDFVELKENDVKDVTGGSGLIYDDNAYPNGPCPHGDGGILIEQVNPSVPCRVLVCNVCHQGYMFD